MKAVLAAVALAACGEVRSAPRTPPTWEDDLRPALEARCGRCHQGDGAAGGWSVGRYTDALSCREDVAGEAVYATRLLRALEREDHRDHVDATVRARVTAWLAAGALARGGSAHDPGVIDPRSSAFHGRVLRASRWAPMLDGARPDACGRCHDGAPARPSGVTRAATAAGATPCTDCHRGPEGALGCDTCHRGAGAPSAGGCLPWRAPRGDSHAAHTASGALLPAVLGCQTCHPPRATELVSGAHGDGVVDVRFDAATAGEGARFEGATGQCSVRCHGGPASALPRWGSGSLGAPCQGCHQSPPRDHPSGTCDRCHAEVNARGTALTRAGLHLNGRVDLGDGSGTCSACHGTPGDPSPTDRVHRAHSGTPVTLAVACAECHEVPATVRAPGHLEDRGVGDLRFGPRAAARSALPRWDGHTCSAVACHGEGLTGRSASVIAWDAPALRCDGCHGAPPTFPHTTVESCELATCHGSTFERVGGALRARRETRRAHIDGFLQAGPP